MEPDPQEIGPLSNFTKNSKKNNFRGPYLQGIKAIIA